MNIIQEIQQQIEKLRIVLQHCDLPEMKEIIETRILAIQVRTQINDLEQRIEKLSRQRDAVEQEEQKECSFCHTKRKDEEGVPLDNRIFLCTNCRMTINNVMTTNKAEERWSLPKGTIKADCNTKRLSKYQDAGLIFKSGKFWLIHEIVMLNHYETNHKTYEIK